MLREKLLSILLHLCDEHNFDTNIHHKKCSHGDLGERPWLERDSLVRLNNQNYASFHTRQIQAVKKVEAAIRGHQNSRLEDLSMMTSEYYYQSSSCY